MSSKVRIMKFGGTSISTPERRQVAALRVVSAKEQGYSPVVVISAIGRKGEPYATDTLLEMLWAIDQNVEPEQREADLLSACGEIISATIFSHTLKTLGHMAETFRGGQAGIRTDGVYSNARVVGINPVSILKSLERGIIPVVCGFQGLYVRGDGAPGGELTTLGRGGSDTTAAALGAALKAELVEIYTDVDGVKLTNPEIVPHAPTLRTMTYAEVAELAHLGAHVLHPRAAEIAMKYCIPLCIKNTFSEDEGTSVVNCPSFSERQITGIAHTGKLIYLSLNFTRVFDEHRGRLQSSIYSLMADYGFNLYMMDLSALGIGFAIPRQQFPKVEEILDGLVLPLGGPEQVHYLFQVGSKPSRQVQTQLKLLGAVGSLRKLIVEPTENCTMVSAVAHEYLQQPGIFLRIFKAFDEAQIPVLQTSDSDTSLSFLVPEADKERAVRTMFESLDFSSCS